MFIRTNGDRGMKWNKSTRQWPQCGTFYYTTISDSSKCLNHERKCGVKESERDTINEMWKSRWDPSLREGKKAENTFWGQIRSIPDTKKLFFFLLGDTM